MPLNLKISLLHVSVLALSALATSIASGAQTSFSDMSAGPMSVGFNSGGDGMSVTYKGVRIVRDSTIWVHDPTWSKHPYGLPQIKDDIKFRDVPGGREALITHRSDAFLGTQLITVKAGRVDVVFHFKLLQDIADADLEYCLGDFCAAPITACKFSSKASDGSLESGMMPTVAKNSDLLQASATAKPFQSIAMDSRVGRMTVETTGDPGSMSFLDARHNENESDDRQPVFWVGVLGIHLEYGKEYTCGASIAIDPLPARTNPPAVVAKGSVSPAPGLRRTVPAPIHVIPEPQKVALTKTDFTLTPATVIVVAKNAEGLDLEGAKSFAEEMKTLYGLDLKIEREGIRASSAIYVGEAAHHAQLASLAQSLGLKAPVKEEGYVLRADSKRVLVVGADRRGSYYGMQTLKQLIKTAGRRLLIQGCTIDDWPALKFRAVHLFVSNTSRPFHEKLIDRILSRYKFNAVVLEVDYMKYKHAPELAVPFSADQSDVKAEIDCARKHLMDAYPLFESLGHCDQLFKNGHNLDLAEVPEKPYAYCPSQPRLYPYLFKFYDEIVELFDHPKFVHIGHDEVFDQNTFPKCKDCIKKPFEQHFIDDVNKIREHLAAKGAKTMLWGDMMLYKGDDPDAMNAQSASQAVWMRAKLPKDVIVTDWHYAAGKPEEFKSIGLFTEGGHDTIASSWFTPANIESFSKQAKNVGAYGLLQTTWAGFLSDEKTMGEAFSQFSVMVLAGEYAWNSGRLPLAQVPYKWDEEFRRQWNPVPFASQQAGGFTVDLSSAYNVCLQDRGQARGWLGLGHENDLASIPNGVVRLKSDLFQLAKDNARPSAIRLASSLDIEPRYPESVSIQIGRKAKSLLFLQTALWTDLTNRKVGQYRVRYDDGTSSNIDLLYGNNLISWEDCRSLRFADRVWEGRTFSGEKLAIHRMEWRNPSPSKTIASIELVSSGTEAGPVILGISGIE